MDSKAFVATLLVVVRLAPKEKPRGWFLTARRTAREAALAEIVLKEA
jgi:hypothetical protein